MTDGGLTVAVAIREAFLHVMGAITRSQHSTSTRINNLKYRVNLGLEKTNHKLSTKIGDSEKNVLAKQTEHYVSTISAIHETSNEYKLQLWQIAAEHKESLHRIERRLDKLTWLSAVLGVLSSISILVAIQEYNFAHSRLSAPAPIVVTVPAAK